MGIDIAEKSLAYDVNKILQLRRIIDTDRRLSQAFPKLETLILSHFNAERVSFFQRSIMNQELRATLKTGDEVKEITLPLNSKSIAGYVALSQKPVFIQSTQDQEEINKIHPQLRFNGEIDALTGYRTHNIICVPIMNSGAMLGVMQILNRLDFELSKSNLQYAVDIGKLVGRLCKTEIFDTSHPLDYVSSKGLISRDSLEDIKANSNSTEEAITKLQNKGISNELIGESLSIHYQVPYIAYNPFKIKLSSLNQRVNKAYLKRNRTVVLERIDGSCVILTADPSNAAAVLEVENIISVERCTIAVGLPEHIERYLNESGKSKHFNTLSMLAEQLNQEEGETLEEIKHNSSDNDPILVQFVYKIIENAYQLGASDIHIDPNTKGETLIRYRIDGECLDIQRVSAKEHKRIVSRIKIMANLNVADNRLPQDGKFSVNVSNKDVEVRVATIPTVDGESLVLRILSTNELLKLSSLNFSNSVEKNLIKLIKKPHGIFLVVGPTGSGKTTTLHSILEYINESNTVIWTAEDPVEINQTRIKQVQIKPNIGLTFEKALRAFLRADPDVILIGEMRDRETAQAAVEGSLTGHLVFSTLHTNTSAATISRLLEMGMDPFNFSDACLGILAQRLIRTLCNHCKTETTIRNDDLEFLQQYLADELMQQKNITPSMKMYYPNGCEHCLDTGYKGRMGVHELLTMSEPMRKMVRGKKSTEELNRQAKQEGMLTMLQDSLLKAIAGHTDIKQVRLIHGLSDNNDQSQTNAEPHQLDH